MGRAAIGRERDGGEGDDLTQRPPSKHASPTPTDVTRRTRVLFLRHPCGNEVQLSITKYYSPLPANHSTSGSDLSHPTLLVGLRQLVRIDGHARCLDMRQYRELLRPQSHSERDPCKIARLYIHYHKADSALSAAERLRLNLELLSYALLRRVGRDLQQLLCAQDPWTQRISSKSRPSRNPNAY
jgi:hypothetical protein